MIVFASLISPLSIIRLSSFLSTQTADKNSSSSKNRLFGDIKLCKREEIHDEINITIDKPEVEGE